MFRCFFLSIRKIRKQWYNSSTAKLFKIFLIGILMQFKVIGRPEFFFSLTKEQIELLLKLSNTHDDADSRSLSKPGGFIYGWQVRLDQKTAVDVSATWRQLDSLSKVMENIMGLTNEQKMAANLLAAAIAAILLASRDTICPPWEKIVNTAALTAEKEYIISTFNTSNGAWSPMNQKGVSIIHVPSGLEARHGDAHSAHRNKLVAWNELQVKVCEWKLLRME